MGWFDDNDPNGEEADAAMNEVMDNLGMGAHKWQKDPQPAGGAPEPKKVEFPESDWDSTKWRKTNLKEHVNTDLLRCCLSCSHEYL